MVARSIPIQTMNSPPPVAVITLSDTLEKYAAEGMEFVISPIVTSEHGKNENQTIGFTLRALGAEPASVHRAAMIAPNHPVNQATIMGDNQTVKEL